MSSLLEQAIVDAQALKEAAMKNAEATIIDKYSDEVKSTLNQLLEQDELAAASRHGYRSTRCRRDHGRRSREG